MKRFTLLILLMCIMAVSFGQVLKTAKQSLSKQEVISDQTYTPGSTKTSPNVIWQTTFNWKDATNPRGWSKPNGWTIKDNSDLGNVWVWRKDSIRGNYTNQTAPPSWFESPDDGFICLPMDEYNSRDGVTTDVAMDSYIETEPIDCSKYSSVVVKFNQQFRYCCLFSSVHLNMFVTTDGVHWSTAFDCAFGTGVNNWPFARYRNVEFNISDIAAGSRTVKLRFIVTGATHYFWAIDDLKLVEAYENEVVLEDTWMDFDGGAGASVGHINYWPLSQMGIAGTTSGKVGSYFMKGALLNNGLSAAENLKLDLKVLKNGTQVYSDQSPGKTLEPIMRDTQKIVNPYLANDYGDYEFQYAAVFNQTDQVPSNNTAKMYFTVDDTMAHRADFSAERSYNTANWVGWGVAGDMVGISYDVYAPTEVNSVTAYISNFTAAQEPQFQFVIMKDVAGVYQELLASEVKEMDSSLRNRWVTLPLSKDGEAEFLQPGNYAVMMRSWGTLPDNPNGAPGMSIGVDLTTKDSHSLCYRIDTDTWYGSGMLAMIGFNITATGGPTIAPVTFNVDMTKHIASGQFKPGTDFVDVAGTFNSWTGSAHLADPENDGIYTITLPGMPVGDTIQYKYRINGDWNTSEYPNGGPSRKYRVRYWNVLNNIYNGGVTTGVDQNSLVASFIVYPNPTKDAFNVSVSNLVASDLVITLTNTQGQVIYRNIVSKVVNHQETIDKKLSKGLYFLTVNNGKEVKVQKVIVQ